MDSRSSYRPCHGAPGNLLGFAFFPRLRTFLNALLLPTPLPQERFPTAAPHTLLKREEVEPGARRRHHNAPPGSGYRTSREAATAALSDESPQL